MAAEQPFPISFRQNKKFETRGSLIADLESLARDYYGNFNKVMWVNLAMDYDMLKNTIKVYYSIMSSLVKIGYAWHINFCSNRNHQWNDTNLVTTHMPYNESFVRLAYYLRKATSYKGILRTHLECLDRISTSSGTIMYMVEKTYVREYNSIGICLLRWFKDFYTQLNTNPQMMVEFYKRNSGSDQHRGIGQDLAAFFNYLRNMESFLEQFFKVK